MNVRLDAVTQGKVRGRPLGHDLVAIGLFVFSTLLALVFMFPFVWTVSSSLKTGWEVVAYPPTLIPKVPQWGNFREAWTATQFDAFFVNTAIVTVLSVIGTLTSSFAVAYGFARFDFPGREFLFLVCLSGMMMPIYVTIIPLFLMFTKIQWIDSLKPLIVPSFFGSAFAIFLFRQFIMTIPYDFDESAFLDGATRARILISIIVPNCKPALATLAIFTFMGTWNSFLPPLIFLDSVEKFTLSLGLWFLRSYVQDPTEPRDHLLMAGTLITTIPIVVVFMFGQRYFTQGVVMSGIKG